MLVAVHIVSIFNRLFRCILLEDDDAFCVDVADDGGEGNSEGNSEEEEEGEGDNSTEAEKEVEEEAKEVEEEVEEEGEDSNMAAAVSMSPWLDWIASRACIGSKPMLHNMATSSGKDKSCFSTAAVVGGGGGGVATVVGVVVVVVVVVGVGGSGSGGVANADDIDVAAVARTAVVGEWFLRS